MEPSGFVNKDSVFRSHEYEEMSRRATRAFHRTWTEVRMSLHALDPVDGERTEPLKVIAEIRRKFDYLDGLSWILFDRRTRRTIIELRRSLRAVEQETRRRRFKDAERERVASLQRIRDAETVFQIRPFEVEQVLPGTSPLFAFVHLALIGDDVEPAMEDQIREKIDRIGGVIVTSIPISSVTSVRIPFEDEPDVALLAIADPCPAATAIRRQFPQIAVVIISASPNYQELFEAVWAGVSAYCDSEIDASELVHTIQRCAAGAFVINDQILERPAVARRVLEQFRFASAREAAEEASNPFTNRELDILRRASDGKTSSESSTQGSFDPELAEILRKLPPGDRTRAVVTALKRGWLQVDRNHDITGNVSSRHKEPLDPDLPAERGGNEKLVRYSGDR